MNKYKLFSILILLSIMFLFTGCKSINNFKYDTLPAPALGNEVDALSISINDVNYNFNDDMTFDEVIKLMKKQHYYGRNYQVIIDINDSNIKSKTKGFLCTVKINNSEKYAAYAEWQYDDLKSSEKYIYNKYTSESFKIINSFKKRCNPEELLYAHYIDMSESYVYIIPGVPAELPEGTHAQHDILLKLNDHSVLVPQLVGTRYNNYDCDECNCYKSFELYDNYIVLKQKHFHVYDELVDEIIDLSDDVIMEKVIYISTEDLNFHYVEMKVFSDNNIVYSVYENIINENKSEEAKAYVDSITKQATEKCPF